MCEMLYGEPNNLQMTRASSARGVLWCHAASDAVRKHLLPQGFNNSIDNRHCLVHQ